jgi:hypothetical protein
MALKRFRPVQYPTHFAVIDHGSPVVDEDGTVLATTVAAGQDAGEQVALYRQDGDPDDPDTVAAVVWRSPGNTAADCQAAVDEAARLNESEG